jgi:hypothetical protein
MLFFILLPLFFQDQVKIKPSREFEITTKYELKKKPVNENTKIVFVDPAENLKKERESGTDMLPYLIINLKVKKWNNDVTQVRVVNSSNKVYLKKKVTDDGLYSWEMGYIDDIKDKVTPGKFTVQFIADKKSIEQINVEVEEDGTFLVNGERRGKF